MVPLFAKPGLAALALHWRLALMAPLALGDAVNGAKPALAKSSQSSAENPKSGYAKPLATESALPTSKEDLESAFRKNPEKLGSISVGRPSRGALLFGVMPKESDSIRLMAKDAAFGTDETIAALERVAIRMQDLFPKSSPLVIGHISDKDGGKLRPHLSHQSGRDVDLGFYYTDKPTWYRRANAKNLDLPRTWALIRTLVTETDVEMIFVDQGLQSLLLDYAKAHETDHAWLELLFKGVGSELPTIRHARGHATHLHVRFYSPRAQKLGHDLYPLLVEQELVPKADSFRTFVAKKGDSLEKIAKRYGVSIKQFKALNGMKGNTIIAKVSYRIPGARGVSPDAAASVVLPARRLPKTPAK